MKKNFWGQISFFEKKKSKKILEKIWKIFIFYFFLSIFSILWSHILTQIDFFRQNHYPII